MANDKKFRAKNGILTQESVVIGSTSWNAYDILQVTGNTSIDGSLSISGPGAYSLDLRNIATNDFAIYNSNVNTGIVFNAGISGLEIQYGGTTKLDFTSTGIDFKEDPTVNSNIIWHAGNDGSGSGLDADVLDGIDSTQFLRSDEDDTFDGNLIITGNLTVSGTTTYINTEEILLSDNIITLNANYVGSTPTENAGIEVERGTLNNPKLLWDETSDYWKLIDASLTDLGRIITTADEGPGNGFDADTVDGLHAEQFLRSDADDTATGNITIEGDLKVGNDSGGAYIYMDGGGLNRVLYSDQGQIGFLNTGLNWAARSDNNNNFFVGNDVIANRHLRAKQSVYANNDVFAADDIVAGGAIGAGENITTPANVVAAKFVDADNNSYELDPAGTSILNTLGIDSDLFHNGDTDTKITFTTDDISIQTGGSERLGIDNDSADFSVSVYAPIYYDSDDDTYYGNFASTSRLNDISLVGEIIHDGDTDTYLEFNDSDSFRVVTGNVARLTVNNTAVTISHEVRAPIYKDSDDLNYYGNFASTSRINDISLVGEIIHDGDTDTYITFSAADTFTVRTGGSDRFNVTNTYSESIVDMRAPRFVDRDDNNYYGDFAGISVMGTIDLDDYIRHNGDTDTYFGFSAADTYKLFTGGGERLNIDNNSADFGVNVYAPRYYDSNDDTYYLDPASTSELNAANFAGLVTGVNIQLSEDISANNGIFSGDISANDGTFTGNITAVNATFSGDASAANMYAGVYYDADNNDYYGDFASSSRMNRINLVDKIRRDGNIDTWIRFPANDQLDVYTNNVRRLLITNTYNEFTNEVRAPRFVDYDNNSYYLDPANTTTSLTAGGKALLGNITGGDRWGDNSGNGGIALMPHGSYAAGQNTTFSMSGSNGGYSLMYLNRIGIGANPFNNSNRFMAFYTNGTQMFTIRGDSSNNGYLILDADGNFTIYNSIGVAPLSAHGSTSNVIINGDTPLYFDGGDNTPVTTAINPAKLHVNGSIYLNGNNDGIIFGRGTASFLRDEELGFGWGGGWYMEDADYLRVRNNIDVYSTGDIYMNRYYDVNNTNRWIEPGGGGSLLGNFEFASNSTGTSYSTAAIELRESNYTNNGTATPPHLGFHWGSVVASQISIESDGRIVVRDNPGTGYEDFGADNIYGNAFIDISDNDYSFTPETSNSWRLATPSGYVDIGPKNTSYSHFDTDRAAFYFNKIAYFNGGASAYDSNDNAYFPRYYDWNDNNFYGDFADTSIMARIQLPQNPVGTSYTSTSTQPTYWIGQTSGDNDGWKIYGESPSGTNTGALVLQSEDDFDGNESIRHRFKRTSSPYNTRDNLVTYFDYVYSPTEFRAPIFRDSNDGSYYVDPASTSITNIMRANRYQVDGSTYFIDTASGDYGSIRVEGTKNSWAGYAINDDWVFMASGPSEAGIYNDTDNKWAIYFSRNAGTDLYYNGAKQAETENGYFLATNQMRSPIYYPPSGTTYFLDLDVGNTSNSLRVPGIIRRDNFQTSGDGNNNILLDAQDYSHWIWRTATNWGIFWAGNDNPYRSHFSTTNPNEIVFIGNGALRASIDLDNGNAYFGGQVSASDFALNGGNENISLSPQYTRGYADETLFDGTMYWEKRVTKVMRGNEDNATGTTSEYVKSTNAPGSSSYVLRTSGYRTFYSDYIEVEPGEEVYGEMSVRYISGSGGLFYYGLERFDKDKRPITSNTGTTYFVAGGSNVTSSSWQTFRAYTDIPTSHTPYNGSDGGGVRYVRIRILMNYNSGGALREFTPPILKRSKYRGRLRGDDIVVTGDITASNYMYSQRFYDTNDQNYYADPAGNSQMNNVDVNRLRTRGSTGYFWDGNDQLSMHVYGEISNTNYVPGSLQPGALNIGHTDRNYSWDGSTWASDVRVGILANCLDYWEMAVHDSGESVESILYYRSDTNTIDMGRNIGWGTTKVRHINSTSSPIYYDLDDESNFYGDFNALSRMQRIQLVPTAGYNSSGGIPATIRIGDESNNTNATLQESRRPDITLRGQYPQLNIMSSRVNNSTHGPTLRFVAYDSANASTGNYKHWVIGTAGTNATSLHFGYSPNRDNPHYGIGQGWSSGNDLSIFWLQNDRHVYAENTIYARRFTDRDSTSYWAEPGDRSYLNTLTLGGYDQNQPWNGQWYDQSTYAYSGALGVRYFWIRVGRTNTNGAKGILQYYAKSDVNYSAFVRGTVVVSSWNNSSMSVGHSSDYPHDGITPEVRIDNDRYLWLRMNGCTWDSRLWWRWIRQDGITPENGSTKIEPGTPPNSTNTINAGQGFRGTLGAVAGGNPYNLRTYLGDLTVRGNIYAPIYYDSDNDGYYGNFAGTSRMNEISVNRINYVAGGPAYFYTSAGNLRGYIRATDSDDSHFEFATSGGEDIIFRDGGFGGDWNMIIRGNGQVLASSRMDAPRFYDRNDPNYYGDFASTNRFNATENYGKVFFYARQNDSGGSWDYAPAGSRVREYLQNTAAEFHSGNDAPVSIYFRSGVNVPSDFGYITFDPDYDNSGEQAAMVIGVENDGTGSSDYIRLQARTWVDSDLISSDNTEIMRWLYQGSTYGAINTSYLYHITDIRAPIYRDWNDAGYYVDPNAGSQLRQVYANDWFRPQGATGVYWQSYDTRIFSDSSSYIKSRSNNGWVIYDRNANLKGYLYFDSANFGLLHNGGGWAVRTFNGGGELYGIFYGDDVRNYVTRDRDNTAYYFEGGADNSTRFRGVQSETMAFMALPGHTRNSAEYYRARPRITSDTNYWTGAMGWGTVDMNAVATWGSGFIDSWSNPANQPSGTSHWVGTQAFHYRSSNTNGYGWQLVGGPIGNLRFRQSWPSWGPWRTVPMLDVNDNSGGAMYAGIYYDSNDPGYYVNPNGDSQMSAVYANNWFRAQNNVGVYWQSHDTRIFSDGSTYIKTYSDRGWVFYDRSANLRGYVYHDTSGNFGLLSRDGNWRVRVNNGYQELYGETYGNDARFYIYRDRDNTGYFLNPASEHNSNINGINQRSMAMIGQSATSYDSRDYYMARPRATSDTRYWTGAAGWGTVDMNDVADWGSGFFDSWSNPANQPSGTSHWVGVQAYHYTNNSARYGWQLAGGPISNLRFRNTWSSFSGWTTVAMHDRNDASGGWLYAGRFVDSDSTGYYTDPASTSRMNQIQANTYYSPYNGGNSGLARSSYPYGWGFQETGSWTNPYPDLVLQYHTGVTMAANASYGGIRFERDYNSDTINFIIGGSSNYMYKYNWMWTDTTGYYSGTNGWHIEPNTQTNYGSMNIRGSRNGWYGIGFYQADRDPHLMFNQRGSGAGGLYWEDSGRWAIYWYENDACLGVASSSTSSTYELYVSGDIYATGNVVAYSDERRKRNIETIDNALEKVLKLRGVSYNKVATPNDENKKDEIEAFVSEDGELLRKTEIGVIAQEVDKVLPEVVTYASDVDEYSVNYGNMAGLFIEAIKDQQDIINKQQEQIDELKDMVKMLMEKL